MTMQEGYTHIILILDKSGSMLPKKSELITGFNHFLEEQKKLPGKATITVTQFSSEVAQTEILPLTMIAPLEESTYKPNGWTALLDAIGLTLDRVGEELAALPEDKRPSQVIVGIFTDGEENYSKQYTGMQVQAKIREQRDVYKWQFVFIGTEDINVKDVAAKLYIDMNVSVPASAAGAKEAMSYTADAVSSYRSGGADALQRNYINSKSNNN
jgi:uncharacterized protein YegL